MHKLVLLLSCLICWTAAGRLGLEKKLSWLDQLRNTKNADERLLHSLPLVNQHQRFLLDILLQLHKPLVNAELNELGQDLVTEDAAYAEPIDEVLLEFLELCRNHDVLGRADNYNDLDTQHVRHLMGLYRFLMLARDWPTFQRNLCYARLHINPVMLVNALLWTLRKRGDTREIIMPPLNEILPQLYYDHDVIATAENVDWNQLAATTIKPSLLDIVGARSRWSLLNPKKLLHLARLGLRHPWQGNMDELLVDIPQIIGNNKIVVPVKPRTGIALLTGDIGMNIFWNNVMREQYMRLVDGEMAQSIEKGNDVDIVTVDDSTYNEENQFIKNENYNLRKRRNLDMQNHEEDNESQRMDEINNTIYNADENKPKSSEPLIDGDRLMPLRENVKVAEQSERQKWLSRIEELKKIHHNMDKNNAQNYGRIIDGDRLVGRRENVTADEVIPLRQRRNVGNMYTMQNNKLLQQRRGEIFMQNMQQLLARINMEKLSQNGVALNPLDGENKRIVQQVMQNLRKAIDLTLSPKSKTQMSITDILQVVADIINGQALKSQIKTFNVADLSQPLQQHILAELVELMDAYQQMLVQPYASEELLAPVSINNVHIDNLLTYIEAVDTDLVNLIDQQLLLSKANNVELLQKQLVARQQRLNHEPFTISYNLDALTSGSYVIRTFLSPKVAESGRPITLTEDRLSFMLIDAFVKHLQEGNNVVVRKSDDITWTTADVSTLSEIYHIVMTGQALRQLKGSNCRFPQRLLIPSGTVDGLGVQLLVVVTPVIESDRELQEMMKYAEVCGLGVAGMSLDHLPLNFPLDRVIIKEENFMLPNIIRTDAVIRHDERLRSNI